MNTGRRVSIVSPMAGRPVAIRAMARPLGGNNSQTPFLGQRRSLHPHILHLKGRRDGRRVVLVQARVGLDDYYQILGVTTAASDREIKAAFRKKAKELHPDVNKGPGAEEQFMKCKEAYQVLSDPDQRAQYDRLRSGRAGWSNRTGSRGYGSPSSSSSTSYDPFDDIFASYARRSGATGGTREQFYGLEDFLKDLEKDTDEFQKRVRAKRGNKKPESLWEELADLGSALGEEFVEFLEDAAGIKGQAATGGDGRPSSSSSNGPWYDDVFRNAQASTTSSSSSSSSTSNAGSGPRTPGSNASSAASGSTSSTGPTAASSSSSGPRYKPPPPPPRGATEKEVDDMLAELKKKMGMK